MANRCSTNWEQLLDMPMIVIYSYFEQAMYDLQVENYKLQMQLLPFAK